MAKDIEQSLKCMIDNIHQLQVKKGPYYDKWLRHYRQAVECHCVSLCKNYNWGSWLDGMNAYLKREKSRSAKGGQ